MLQRWERRTRSLAVRGFVFATAVSIVSLAFGDKPDRFKVIEKPAPKKAAEDAPRSVVEVIPNPTYHPKPGDRALLCSYSRKHDRLLGTFVAVRATAYRDYWKALMVDDDDGMNLLKDQEDVVLIPILTSVLVLELEKFEADDPRPDLAVVRIMDGPKRGAMYWSPAYSVSRMIPNPDYSPDAVKEQAAREAERTERAKPKKKGYFDYTDRERKAIMEGAARQESGSWLNIAENLRKDRKYAAARKWYNDILKRFPTQEAATKARERLRTLPK
jgi:hypothetical protein